MFFFFSCQPGCLECGFPSAKPLALHTLPSAGHHLAGLSFLVMKLKEKLPMKSRFSSFGVLLRKLGQLTSKGFLLSPVFVCWNLLAPMDFCWLATPGNGTGRQDAAPAGRCQAEAVPPKREPLPRLPERNRAAGKDGAVTELRCGSRCGLKSSEKLFFFFAAFLGD